MKTIAVVVVLSWMSLCLVNSERVTKYGHQSYTRVLDKQTFTANPKEGEIQRINFVYPPNGELSEKPIVGLVHRDNAKQPVTIRFLDGSKLARKFVVSIESATGSDINSTFEYHVVKYY